MCSRSWAQGLAQRVDRLEVERGLARSEDERSDEHMQPVNASGVDEGRDGARSTFNEKAPKAALAERGNDGAGAKRPSVRGQSEHIEHFGRLRLLPGHH